MRKAFDANVPKLKPRLRAAGAVQVSDEQPEAASPDAAHESEVVAEELTPAAALAGTAQVVDLEPEAMAEEGEAPVERAEALPSVAAPAAAPQARASEVRPAIVAPQPVAAPAAAAPTAPVPAPAPERTAAPERSLGVPAEVVSIVDPDVSDVLARRERLLEVKRKVEDAVRPRPRPEPAPESPARAGESAIALVKELESQLARAREVETALRADLEDARAEVARGAADVRRVTERLAAAETEVESKRGVLSELLDEMKALEQERDRAMERAQALATLDEERQELLDALSTRADDAEKARGAAESEIERLGAELDERAADGARLRAALAAVTRERDDLAREAATAKREKQELEEARRALEAVHDALSQARTRLG